MGERILIVEDDHAILRGLEMNLQLDGYETVAATDGRAALKAVREGNLDLVVLDIMLPHVNGFQVLETLRQRGDDVPVIVLSAKATELDKVMGLGLGADDYVTKPFSVAELLARIRVRLRRRSPAERVRFGDVEIDLARREVRRGGADVPLTSREFDLLAFLVQREGRPLTRETILSNVWGTHYFGTDRTVDNFITRLRQKLDTPGEPCHFLTVRGVGYRFVLDAP
ncbi:MAG: response regulator transcription factor [Deltaproteobacteria bacterium]|nr:response regulator transcription factor [Deltaproteobacteria bacterium]